MVDGFLIPRAGGACIRASRKRIRLVYLDEAKHDDANFNMPSLMLMRHNKRTCDVAGELAFAGFQVMIKVSKTSANTVPECDDSLEGGPVFVFLWDLRMVLLRDGS